MSNDSTPRFDDVDDAAKAAGSSPTREDSINSLGDPDADGEFQDRTDKDAEEVGE